MLSIRFGLISSRSNNNITELFCLFCPLPLDFAHTSSFRSQTAWAFKVFDFHWPQWSQALLNKHNIACKYFFISLSCLCMFFPIANRTDFLASFWRVDDFQHRLGVSEAFQWLRKSWHTKHVVECLDLHYILLTFL